MNENVSATWIIELRCECPECGQWVDLLDFADFWEGRKLGIAESGTDVEVACPECKHEFKVDCEY